MATLGFVPAAHDQWSWPCHRHDRPYRIGFRRRLPSGQQKGAERASSCEQIQDHEGDEDVQ